MPVVKCNSVFMQAAFEEFSEAKGKKNNTKETEKAIKEVQEKV